MGGVGVGVVLACVAVLPGIVAGKCAGEGGAICKAGAAVLGKSPCIM